MNSPLFKHNQHLYTSRLNDEEELLPPMRLGARAGTFAFDLLRENDSPWHETKEEAEDGLETARQNRQKLARVRTAMYAHLDKSEIEVIELRFFQGLTLRQIGKIMDRSASTIHRKIKRVIIKLRRLLVLPE